MMLVNETTEELFQQREKRVLDAIALRKPDRVPVIALFGSFPAKYCGLTCEEDANDIEKSLAANLQANIDFQPDTAFPASSIAGSLLGALDYRQLKWAGHGLPSDHDFQSVEDDWMKADEYDVFIYDPSDFVVRKYWPRVFGKLAVLGNLPPLRHLVGYFAMPLGFMAWGLPGAAEALEALARAGAEGLKYVHAMGAHVAQLKEAGFPVMFLAGAQPPFDLTGDFLRGRKGAIFDMYRRPEMLLASAEKMLPTAIEMGVMGARMTGNPRVFIAIHGGVEHFMSLAQYEKFFWPTFRQLLWALVENGLNPIVLVEGGSTSRLELMADVPPGKICYVFQDVDMAKARKVLGGKVCIAGNVPLSLLALGAPDEVTEHCKRLIDTMAGDGGYILSAGGSMDDAKPENVKAMINCARDYGVY